jgi:hypothetical protein
MNGFCRGERRSADINALVIESLNLAYQTETTILK